MYAISRIESAVNYVSIMHCSLSVSMRNDECTALRVSCVAEEMITAIGPGWYV